MTERSTTHATFAIERVYEATAARVFGAWANLDAKAQWMACHPEWKTVEQTLDFRVGGREVHRVGPVGGPLHIFEARYHDIVPDRRIVYAYDMYLGDRKISVSLVTIDLAPAGKKTRLTFTEQGVFLDGYDGAAEREEGTRIGLDRLIPLLRQAA